MIARLVSSHGELLKGTLLGYVPALLANRGQGGRGLPVTNTD